MQTNTVSGGVPPLENLLQIMRQLPRTELEQLQEALRETLLESKIENKPPRDKRIEPIITNTDFSLSVKWLMEHSADYSGQWVALDGELLLAHGMDPKEVFAAADAAGVQHPLVTQVEDSNALPFAGF